MVSQKNGIRQRIAHSHATEDGKSQNIVMNVLRKFLTKLLLQNATDYLAVSQEAGESLFQNHPFEIVHNGIDLELYSKNSEAKVNKRKRIGYLNEYFCCGKHWTIRETKINLIC